MQLHETDVSRVRLSSGQVRGTFVVSRARVVAGPVQVSDVVALSHITGVAGQRRRRLVLRVSL